MQAQAVDIDLHSRQVVRPTLQEVPNGRHQIGQRLGLEPVGIDTTHRKETVDQRIAYEVQSYINYRTEVDLSEYARTWYQRLPDNSNERTRELAVRMREAAGSDAEML